MVVRHVARGSAGELGSTILEGKVEGKRSRGRPKATWLDNIKDWTGLSLHAAVQRAKDRHSWIYTAKLAASLATHPQSEEGIGKIDRYGLELFMIYFMNVSFFV